MRKPKNLPPVNADMGPVVRLIPHLQLLLGVRAPRLGACAVLRIGAWANSRQTCWFTWKAEGVRGQQALQVHLAVRIRPSVQAQATARDKDRDKEAALRTMPHHPGEQWQKLCMHTPCPEQLLPPQPEYKLMQVQLLV